MSRQALEALVGDFAASASTTNTTTQALIDALHGVKRHLADEVPIRICTQVVSRGFQ